MSFAQLRSKYFNFERRVQPQAPSFDPATMAAMNQPWPVIVFSPVRAAASGLTPSEYINNP